ncbi:MAG: ATP-binding protein, partial [Armatimonadetes bacterium]|nr:ATP-binding protein [Armatimonadota bacterium]
MSTTTLRPWIELVSLHPDVISESFSEDIFALDLGPLADGSRKVPTVYRDAEQFVRASYLTTGLRSLLDDVLSRLEGGGGNRVLKLVTPFGGGKSHTLAALYHAARSRGAFDLIPEGKSLPKPGDARTAVFDGQFFDATKGKDLPGESFRARTMWGWIAWSLGGIKGYEMLRNQDEARVAPGADEILTLLGDEPNLILLDETLQYLISAGGIRVEQTTLRDETLTFLQRLTVAVGNTSRTALAFSLQSSKRESLEYVNLLQTVDHLASRKDQLREPVQGNEVLSVIQRRLLAETPKAEASTPAATAFQDLVTKMRHAYARSAAERQQAEEEGIALRDRVRSSYPFHPALIDIMRERWAAIPDFQRTRGALRFLAACLRAAHRAEKSRVVLGPGDVPMHDSEVRLAFFKEVGQQADYQAVLEHDLTGANARAKRIDERLAKESPTEGARRSATRLATAILMYSFGGLRREGGKEGEMLPPGVTEPELLSACVGPDLESMTALACLKSLREECLYLHYDGVRYCFKKDPNVTLLLEQEAEAVARDETRVRDRIEEMLEERLAGHSDAIVWPDKPGAIPDREPCFLVGYLPLEFGGQPRGTQEATARELFERHLDKLRRHRNGLGLAVPSADQIEILRRAVRYLMAAEQVKSKAKQLGLTDEQKSQLRERESTDRSSAESALLKLYAEVWLPRAENGAIAIEKVAVGGRPLQATLNEKKQALVHERVMELLMTVQKKVHGSIKPKKVVELFRLGEGDPPVLGITAQEVVDGFYSFLGWPRLSSESALARAIAEGVKDGFFGFMTGPVPQLDAEGRYQVLPAKVRFKVTVPEDEIDFESGFLIAPQAIPV